MTKYLGLYYDDGIGTRTLLHGTGKSNQQPNPGHVAPEAGALPIGTAIYDPPANAVWLSKNGSDSDPGTQSAPKATLQAAISACPSGGTIVVRGGVYELKYTGDMIKPLTIQNYGSTALGFAEAVWFDGSSVVPTSSWTNNGNGTWSATLLAQFAHPVPNATDAESRYVDPAYPMSLWPDGVWVNGTRLRQVDSTVTPNSGQFNVNYTTNKATIAVDPTGKEVRLTAIDYFMVVKAKVTFRGFGIRRYACNMKQIMLNCVNASGGSTFENLWLVDAAIQATSINGTGTTWRYCTIQQAGYLGIGTDTNRNTTITNCIIEGSNFEHMNEQPASGAIKLVRATNALVQANVIRNNNCAAVWFDVSCNGVKVLQNDMPGNNQGINFEISHDGTFVNNWITGTIVKAAIQVCDSDQARIWNNLCDRGGSYVYWVHEDNRAGNVSAGENPDGVQTWTVVGTQICNNVDQNSRNISGTWRMLFDSGQSEDASVYFTRVSGNVSCPTLSGGSTASVSRLFAVGQVGSTPTYTTPTAFKNAFPSKVGTNIVTTLTTVTDNDLDSWKSIADPLPDDICDLLGIARGTASVGPILPRPIPRT